MIMGREKQSINVKRSGIAALIIYASVVLLFLAYILIKQPFAPTITLSRNSSDIPLDLEVVSPERSIYISKTEVTIKTNKEITASTNNRTELVPLGRNGAYLYYILKVVNLPLGVNNFDVTFSDGVGHEQSQSFSITRENYAVPLNDEDVFFNLEATYTLDPDTNLSAVVDKQHRLLEDYSPDDLVDINKEYGLYSLNNPTLRREVAVALKQMLENLASATGKYVTIASGYRSYNTQLKTYGGWIKQSGLEEANSFSAKPGFSEHQLGTTLDFVSEDTSWQIESSFGDTVAGQWLRAHAYEYGFIVPYDQDQSGNGGYIEESWHFRYVGLNN